MSTPVTVHRKDRPSSAKFNESTNSTVFKSSSKSKPVQSATYSHYPLRQSVESSHNNSTIQLTPHFYDRSSLPYISNASHFTSTKPYSVLTKEQSSRLNDPSRGYMSSFLLQHSLDSPGHSSGISTEASTSHNFMQVPYTAKSNVNTAPDLPIQSEASRLLDYPVQSGHHSWMLTARAREPLIEPLDVTVDDSYEFDSASPMDPELMEKLRREQLRWRHWQTWQRERNLLAHRNLIESSSSSQSLSTRKVPSSHTETLHSNIVFRQPQYHSYRLPRNKTIEDMEARCAALRKEFLNFRQRQADFETKQSESLPTQQFLISQSANDSSFSDEFESAC